MADNKVNFLRGTSAEYEAKTKDNDTFYYTTDTKKLYLGENEVGNGIDPKVIQAHIDNQTIHAKVWRGTQEEYNAIEPKEDDTVYIIKDSDNTLADKLIDDTSTTATDKTWSAKKINENDEVAKTAINTHAGNDEIHVTAVEKAAWNGKAELSDIPDKLPADGGNADTLDGLHESSFAQNIGVWSEGDIKDLLLACQKSGFVWIQPDVTGMPNDNTYWFGIADCHTVHRQLIVRDINNSVAYCMRWNNGTQTWASWRNLADGGNAASVGAYTEAKIAALEARIAALEGGNV